MYIFSVYSAIHEFLDFGWFVMAGGCHVAFDSVALIMYRYSLELFWLSLTK
jgi:hypothetical protein